MADLAELSAKYAALEAGHAYVAWAIARTMNATTLDAIADVEQRLGPNHPHLGLIKKAAVDPNVYSDDWRGLRRLSDQFFAVFKPATFLGQVSSLVRRVPFLTPTLVQATASDAVWVGEARAIKVSAALDLNAVSLDRLKLALIGLTTAELAKTTDGLALAAIQKDLANSVARGENATVLDDQPAQPGIRPAGLLNGVAPIASGSPPDLAADVSAMYAAVRGGEPQAPVWVVSSSGANYLEIARDASGAATFPTVSSGTLFRAPIIVTAAAADRLILVDCASLIVG